MSDLPHDLESFLDKAGDARPSADFRRQLFEETASALPRRRMPWQASLAAAACLLLALGLMWWFARRAAQSELNPVLVQRPIFEPVVEPGDASPVIVSAADLEWQAFDKPRDDRDARAKLYWSAGQMYIAAEGDYLGALRCYSRALDAGPAELCEITDEDDVLAMALKFDRSRKEKKHDTP
jgi:hypothetical protein